MNIIIPTLLLGVLGAIFGICLAIASKKLAVHIDPKLEKLNSLLPGVNCGACGYAGCMGLAEEILSGKQNVNVCKVIDDKSKEKVANFLGQKAEKHIRKTAIVKCFGGTKVKNRFEYTGQQDCKSANLFLSGFKECIFGCLELASCKNICPFNAITMSEENLPVVDAHKCKACNKCVLECPKKLFALIPASNKVYVACISHDCAKDTRNNCPVGCIDCKMCEKACKFSAIRVNDHIAEIDFTKCTSCLACIKACPRKIIKTTNH